ncbi:DUF262 domain-containing protein [Avibacterium sp. 21-599]|uniref:DUF262 domain-containing protein n=1 Tax=Avibacterium sp. 21-599 TaxID=2911528 RepID=UPI0022468A12|nr:DUF262 domain-containing HNH endonuclease family protein [Avibacterium sp. 21-599]MCW9719010.1 DUF262 domain-containing HNH endonuclease family protein [Avibacterium sp. 21-599]
MIQSAKQITISALLSQDSEGKTFQYVIPPYQREYAWNKNQWDNLFDDLSENDKGYFLGSLICILGEENKSTVIDGQQRLTTLNLLLLAIYNKLKPLRSNSIIAENDDYLEKVVSTKKYFLYKENTRFIASIQNNNRADFEYLVHRIVKGEDNTAPANFGNRRIYKAFKHFSERIETTIEGNIKELFDFLDKVTSACVVRIDTQDETSAFILFESINNRGVPLTPMDLIKNSLISYVKNKTAEETNLEWQKIVNNISDYDVQVRYLRHFYQAFKPINLIFNSTSGKEKITKNDLIKTYTNEIKNDAEKVLNELTKKSEIYKYLSYPENIQERDELWSKYKNKLFDLKKLGIAPAYTLLLFLFEKYPQQNFAHLLKYIEKWFMIRHLTDSPATNRLDEIFIRTTKTQHNEYNEKILLNELQKELPSRERIEEALQSKTLYDDNPALIRYILIYLEQKHRTAENQVDFWAVNEKGKAIWSVEHIYPQKPKEGEWYEDCKDKLHSLGNLTLSAYNSNLSNRSFGEKGEVKDEKGNNIGLKSGNVEINGYLLDKNEWCLEHIEERGNQLRDTFLKDITPMDL